LPPPLRRQTFRHERLRMRVFEDAHFGPLSRNAAGVGRHAVGKHPSDILRRGETE
jgi:hypothetical protein